MASETCAVCDREVNINKKHGWVREVTGWEEVRPAGGANKIMRRKTTGLVAHYSCLTDEVDNQEAFF